jgi:hypothetical protein
MLASVEKRFVFVANTKTASTSIEHLLIPHCEVFRSGTPQRKHITLYDTLQTYRFLFDQPAHAPERYFKFGVMREPLDWIGSWFRYRKGNKVQSPLPADMSFAEFWAMRDWNVLLGNGQPNLQRRMFVGPEGGVLADVIIPYHRLDEMLPEILEQLRIPGSLPRLNVSEITHPPEMPEALREELRAFYAPDYDLWKRLDEINARGMAKLHARSRPAPRPARAEASPPAGP